MQEICQVINLNQATLNVRRFCQFKICHMKSQIIEIGAPFVEVDNHTVSLEDLSVDLQ
jgi:hypothetical protein